MSLGTRHHHGESSGNQRRLLVVFGLTLAYMVAELIGAWVANSLSLLADGGHMFADAVALALAVFATWMAGRPPSPRHTFGFHRAEILAAMANGAVLVALAVLIFREAVGRLQAPVEVRGDLLLLIAAGGLLVNIFGLLVLRKGRQANLNLRGAFLHVASDALGSLQVLLAGLGVKLFGWQRADSLASMVIALLIVSSAWGLLKEAVSVLMEGVPAQVDVDRVREAILGLAGVRGVHDLHVWSIGSEFVVLSAHVSAHPEAGSDLLWRVHELLHREFGIAHTTIQIEPPPQPVPLGPRPEPTSLP